MTEGRVKCGSKIDCILLGSIIPLNILQVFASLDLLIWFDFILLNDYEAHVMNNIKKHVYKEKPLCQLKKAPLTVCVYNLNTHTPISRTLQ